MAALVLAYALGGFVLAPWVAGRELPRLVEQQLNQRARIGEISFNPFTLRLHARAAGLAAPSVADKLRNFASDEPQVVDAREFYQTLLRRVREAQTLPANALPELAQQRALAIEAALQAAGTDASRLSRTIAEPTADAEAKQVTVHLSLAAR